MKIIPEEFNIESNKNPGYSNIEYDLHAKFGMTLRKNLTNGRFEIVKIKNGEIQYDGTIGSMVRIMNELEGEKNTWID